jgi:putative transposase
MKKSRFSESQIIGALREAEGGKSVAEICRALGVTPQCFSKWKKKYEGLDESEMKRLHALEIENLKLKRIVAQQVMDIDSLKALISKKW